MNKETIDYTSEEFWATAPSDATHWEPESYDWMSGWIQIIQDEKFYWSNSDRWQEDSREDECNYEELAKTFIPRPTTFTKADQESNRDWDGTGIPPTGIDCEFQHRNAPNGVWHPTTIRYSSHAYIIYVDTICDEEACYRVNDGCAIDFRPIKKEPTIQEKILDKWKAQALEFAYDTKDSEYPVGSVIHFIVSNYDVKEK